MPEVNGLVFSMVANILADLAIGACAWFLRSVRSFWARHRPSWRFWSLHGAIFAAFAVAFVNSLNIGLSLLWPILTPVALVIVLLYLEARQYWQVGISAIDRTITEGLDYRQALDLSRNSIAFLGIGGSKLTDCKEEFSQAIARCHREERPIRFLLSRPDRGELVDYAKAFGVSQDQYQHRVRESIRILATEKTRAARNIEVRFYRKTAMPVFRLMFIDDSLCLASYYVFGEGDGSQLPQLHIQKASIGRRDVEGLYFAFQRYFESMWKEAEKWQPEEFLGDG